MTKCFGINNGIRLRTKYGVDEGEESYEGSHVYPGQSSLELNESCTMGKLVRRPHKRVTHEQSIRPFELILIDVRGSMLVESLGGSRYQLVLVENYSEYVKIYPMKNIVLRLSH